MDGKAYTTERLRFGESLGTGDPSEPELKRIRYAEGASLTVVYHPGDPAVAAARPGAGLGFLLFGLATWVFGIPSLTRGG